MAKTYEVWIDEVVEDIETGNVLSERPILVQGEYSPAEPQTHWEPGVPDSMKIISATTEDGEEIQLRADDEREALQKLWECVEPDEYPDEDRDTSDED